MRSRRRPTITYRLHAQRALMVPSIMLRRGYLEKVHLAQIQSEKDAILSHIGHLQPRVREEYLRHKQRLLNHDDYVAARTARSTGSTDRATSQVNLRLEKIKRNIYNHIRLNPIDRAEYLKTRDDALTNRISNKAVGL